MRSTRRPLAVLLAVVFAILATGLAAVLWWPVYEHPRFLLAVSVAVVAGVLLSGASVLLHWPGWVLLPATAILFLLTGVPLAVPGLAVAGWLPSAEGLLALISGVVLGWKQLLTITIPVGDYQALLVPVFVLALLSAVAAVRFGVLRRGYGWAILGPVLVAVTGVLFGGAPSPAAVPAALGLVAVCLGWLSGRRLLRRRNLLRGGASARVRSLLRPLAAGAVVLASAVGASLVLTSGIPLLAERQLLRDEIVQPFDPRQEPSPLAGFRAYLREGAVDQVQLRVTGLEPGDRMRIAVLDLYDGVVYGMGGAGSGSFVRVPLTVDLTGKRGSPRNVQVEVGDYRGPWLPVPGLVEQVQFAGSRASVLREDFLVDPIGGTAAVASTVAPGDSYRVSGLVPALLESAAASALTPARSPDLRSEAVPDGVSTLLDSWVGGLSDPGERLAEMIDALRRTGYISHGLGDDEPPSRSGHGADRIAELLTAPQMIGDAEQYAAAAALMAGQLGFPARVVMGFAPAIAADSTVTVVGADISAWIEVETAELGWVGLDPVPELRPIPDVDPDELSRLSRPQSVIPPPLEQLDDRGEQTPPQSERSEQEQMDPVLAAFLAVARIAGIVLLVAAVVSAPFLLVIAAKLQRRRRRRRASTPRGRLRGAWDEYVDAVVDHGSETPPAGTRSEIAAGLSSVSAQRLAAAVDRGVFGPERVDAIQAERAWTESEALRQSLERGRSGWQRLRARLSLRSFGSYRGLRRGEGRREKV